MLGLDHKGETHFNWRRIAVFGILLLLTMVQGTPPTLNPISLSQGNTPEDMSRISTYVTRRSPVDPSSTIHWQQTYGGLGDDVAYAAIETADGGFALAGSRNDPRYRGPEIQLVKTDGNGVYQDYLGYGGSDDYWVYAVIETADGGFALAGSIDRPSSGKDFFLMKTDVNISSQWDRNYGGSGDDIASAIIEMADGGFVLAGYTTSYGAGRNDTWLVKTDESGAVQWSQTYGGSDDDVTYAAIKTADGGFALAGYTLSYGADSADAWLVKTDESGVVQWSQTYGGSYGDGAHSIIQTVDGGFALAGYTLSYGADSADAWLVKTDESGVVQWSQTYGGSWGDVAYAVIETTDGGFALAGYTTSYGAGMTDAWLVKTDESGVVQWSQTYGGSRSYGAYAVIETPDGGFVLAGYTTPYGADDKDFWLVKTVPTLITPTPTPVLEDGSGLTQLTFNAANDRLPSISGDGSKITFHSDVDGDDEIFVVNTDSTGLTQLTDNTARERWPFFVINGDGSKLTQLTNNTAIDRWPVISGDGSKIAFNAEGDYEWEIFVMNTDGTDLTQLTFNSTDNTPPEITRIIRGISELAYEKKVDNAPVISWDGSKIAFNEDEDGDLEIYVMNTDGTGLTQLTHNTAKDRWPAISGDGSKIVFHSDEDGDPEVFVVNTDGTGLTQLTDNTAIDRGPVISGDGSTIAFHSDVDGDAEIYVVNADGTGLTQLTNNTAYDVWPSISGDGSKIAFHSDVDGDAEVFVMNADGTGLIQLTNNTAYDGWPSISRDGSTIAFHSDVDGDYEIFLWRPEETDPEDNSWRPRTPMPTPRGCLATVVVNKRIYAIGGYDGTHTLATMEEYDPLTDMWRPRTPMPTARGWLAATVIGEQIYVLGGSDGENYLSTVEVYDPKSDTWTSRAPMPTPRYGLGVAAVGGRIYAIGGQNEIGEGYQTTVEEYDPMTDTWRPRADMATPRYGLAVGVVQGRIYALGGYNVRDGVIATVEEYNPILNLWTRVADLPTAQISLAAAAVGGRLYAIGGMETYPSPVQEYDPLTNTWVNRTPLPTTRSVLAAAVVRDRLYAIGGYDGNRQLGTVEEYNPPFYDTEGDGFADDVELQYGRDPLVPETDTDTDGDGLSDIAEVATYGTNPWVPDIGADTDDDGLPNVKEVDTYGTIPTAADTDYDRLTDGAEVNTYGTDPLTTDTDGDEFIDGAEVAAGTNPKDPADHPLPSTTAISVTATSTVSTPEFVMVELVLVLVCLVLMVRRTTKR